MNTHRILGALSAVFAPIALLLPFSPQAVAQTIRIDDGTPGASLSYGIPEDLCWLNRLNVATPTEIRSVEIMFGDIAVGTPVRICVWRDLGGYGQPSDALLVSSVVTTVKVPAQQAFAFYDVPPVTVNGSFFVGALLAVDGLDSPATMDPHTPTLGRAWVVFGYGPGTLDPTYLGAYVPYSVSTIGVPGVFMVRANGVNGASPEVYCSAKVNSAGCTPTVAFTGMPSASAGSGFVITATNVLNQRAGLFVYTLAGRRNVAFGGGRLCVTAPLRRTPMALSGGSTSGTDCTGSYQIDFNAYLALGFDPRLVAGETVDGQFWSRDTGFVGANAIGLTQGVHFGIAP